MNSNLDQISEIAELAYRTIISPSLKYPEDLEVFTFWRDEVLIVEPRCNYADFGQLMGKDRAKFDAIQLILALVGRRFNCRFRLNKPQPAVKGDAEFHEPYKQAANWKSDEMKGVLQDIVSQFAKHPVEISCEEDNGEGETKMHIIFSRKEDFQVVTGQIAHSLSKIIHAAGRARGRKIYVTGSEKKA